MRLLEVDARERLLEVTPPIGLQITRPRDSLYVNESRGNCSDPEWPFRVVLSHSPTTEFGQDQSFATTAERVADIAVAHARWINR